MLKENTRLLRWAKVCLSMSVEWWLTLEGSHRVNEKETATIHQLVASGYKSCFQSSYSRRLKMMHCLDCSRHFVFAHKFRPAVGWVTRVYSCPFPWNQFKLCLRGLEWKRETFARLRGSWFLLFCGNPKKHKRYQRRDVTRDTQQSISPRILHVPDYLQDLKY